jgi:branched-chain amino acid transport system permease protein
VRRIIHSPFGLSLQGYRENPARMAQIGAPMAARLRLVNALAAGLAGLAGAVLTQTTQFVGLDSVGFERSADVLIVLILGGGGRLYGGLVGALVFLVGRDVFSEANPQYWYFWLGALLVLIVLFMPQGILGGIDALAARLRRMRKAAS